MTGGSANELADWSSAQLVRLCRRHDDLSMRLRQSEASYLSIQIDTVRMATNLCRRCHKPVIADTDTVSF